MSDVPEEALSSEEAMEVDVTEQQQVAMQQEEKVLTEQIENLQKEKWVWIGSAEGAGAATFQETQVSNTELLYLDWKQVCNRLPIGLTLHTKSPE